MALLNRTPSTAQGLTVRMVVAVKYSFDYFNKHLTNIPIIKFMKLSLCECLNFTSQLLSRVSSGEARDLQPS